MNSNNTISETTFVCALCGAPIIDIATTERKNPLLVDNKVLGYLSSLVYTIKPCECLQNKEVQPEPPSEHL
jgi:hypothetical protein